MRVLHLVDRLTDRGGAYRHLLGVLDALVEAGHDVTLAAGEVQVDPPEGVAVASLPGLGSRTRRAVAAELDALAARVRPDVIHIHTVLNPDALEWAAERDAVMTVQDHRWFCPTRGKWTASDAFCRQPMEEQTCAGCFDDEAYFRSVLQLTRERLAAAVRMRLVVLSRYMKSELEAVGAVPARVHVIPPFVHALPTPEPRKPAHVLFVGRLARTKGVWDAVTAWREARLGLPLAFAGTGPERDALERQGLAVWGWLDRAALAQAYAAAAALVFPPRWQEPFGIVGLEALSLGVPVAAWDSGGIVDWHGPDGLVPWGDVGALASRLRDVIGHRPAKPEGFDRETLMQRLLEVYLSR